MVDSDEVNDQEGKTMILTGHEIEVQRQLGKITIELYNPEQTQPNSYDVRLGDTILVSEQMVLNVRAQPSWTEAFIHSREGFLLVPGMLYLGHTKETIGSDHFVPDISGKSTLGRYGINVHHTAGWGDVGFHGQFTLELSCVQPVRIYPGMPIAQVRFLRTSGEITLYDGHYKNQSGPTGPHGEGIG